MWAIWGFEIWNGGLTASLSWQQYDRIVSVVLRSHVDQLLHWKSHADALKQSLAATRAAVDLPQTRGVVGDSSIDQYGLFPGLVLLNNFSYKPRPMPILFNATDSETTRRDAEFYREDATAPEYLLTVVGTIDGHLYPQEDPLTLLQVLRHYRPVQSEKGILLSKRWPVTREEPMRLCQAPQSHEWEKHIDCPRMSEGWIWCNVDIRPSAYGRIRTFLYKPPPITIFLETQGRPYAACKFLACSGKTGFLINPMILNIADLLHVYQVPLPADAPVAPAPESISFHVDPEARVWYADDIRVSFSIVSKPSWLLNATPVQPVAPDPTP